MKNWDSYLKLKRERPKLFTGKELEIIFDEKIIKEFESETGREIGISYESPWRYVLVDLVRNREGKLFAFERVVPRKTGGVAVLPIYDGKIVLVHEYRHPVQLWCWEIPRGFGETASSALSNAGKELFEETGINKAEFSYMGQLMSDSGLTSDRVDLFLADVKEMSCSIANQEETEVISEMRFFSLGEIKKLIKSGEICDSYTLSAIGMWQLKD